MLTGYWNHRLAISTQHFRRRWFTRFKSISISKPKTRTEIDTEINAEWGPLPSHQCARRFCLKSPLCNRQKNHRCCVRDFKRRPNYSFVIILIPISKFDVAKQQLKTNMLPSELRTRVQLFWLRVKANGSVCISSHPFVSRQVYAVTLRHHLHFISQWNDGRSGVKPVAMRLVVQRTMTIQTNHPTCETVRRTARCTLDRWMVRYENAA